MDVQLDRATHTYTRRGRTVPGVTRVINTILRSPPPVDPEVWKDAGELGELIHEACALDAAGQLDEQSVDPEVAPYLKSWRKFRAEMRPKFIASERIVYHHAYAYAGKLDCQLELNGLDGVLDVKSGVPSRCDEVQVVAYDAARLSDRLGHPPSPCWLLYLRPDGKFSLQKVTLSDYDYLFRVFLAALTSYRWRFSC